MSNEIKRVVGVAAVSFAVTFSMVLGTKKVVDHYHSNQTYSQSQQVVKANRGSVLGEYRSIPEQKRKDTVIGMFIVSETSGMGSKTYNLLLIPPTEDIGRAIKMAYAGTTQNHDCDCRHNLGRDYFVLYADGRISDFVLRCKPVGPTTECKPSSSNFVQIGDTEVWEFGHVATKDGKNNGYLKIKTTTEGKSFSFPSSNGLHAVNVAGNGNSDQLFGVFITKCCELFVGSRVNISNLFSMPFIQGTVFGRSLGEINFDKNAYNYIDCEITNNAKQKGIAGRWVSDDENVYTK